MGFEALLRLVLLYYRTDTSNTLVKHGQDSTVRHVTTLHVSYEELLHHSPPRAFGARQTVIIMSGSRGRLDIWNIGVCTILTVPHLAFDRWAMGV